MLFDVSAEVKQLVRDGTELNADAGPWLAWSAPEFLQQVWMFHQSKSMSDALRLQQRCVIEIRILGIIRPAPVKESFARVKQERDVQRLGIYKSVLARLLKSK